MKGTIIYIGGFELPDKNAAAHRVLSNAKILRKLDYNVVFIDIDRSLRMDDDILQTKKVHQGFDCRSAVYPKSLSEWIKYLTSIENFEKVISQYTNVTAVICYNYPSCTLKKLMKYCRERSIKIISDCTEWYSAVSKNPMFFIIKGIDTFVRMRILHKKLDGIIVISDYLERYYKKCRNIVNIPPLVDLNEPKWHKSDSKTDEAISLVYAGSPARKDKINLIIKAVSKLTKPYKLLIVGITKQQYNKLYPNDETTDNNIIFLGRLSHSDTLEYVKKADYTCFLREDNRVTKAGFPTKFVESVSCGTPVITNNNENIKRFMCDNVYFVPLNNIDFNFINKSEKNIATDQFHYENYIDVFDKFLTAQPKVMITFEENSLHGGPGISHKRIMHSKLNLKYEFIPLMIPKGRYGLFNFRLIKNLVAKIKAANPDFIHIHGLQLVGFYTAVAAWICKKPIVLAIHGSVNEAVEFAGWKKKIVNALEIFTIKLSAVFYGVSKYVMRWKNVKKYADKCYGYIYNMPHCDETADNNIREELGISDSDIVITSTGRITREKGFDILCDVILKMKDTDNIKFIIAGEGEYLNEFISIIKREQLEDKVKILGYREDVAAILEASDIFIILSLHETLCNSVLEACNKSLPVIASNVGGIPEIITGGETGYLVNVNETDKAVDYLNILINSKELRNEFGNKAKKFIDENFSEETAVKKIEEMYKSIVNYE